MAAEWLYGDFLKMMIVKHPDLPYMPGWTWLKGGYAHISRRFSDPVSTDRSGFDFTWQKDHVEFLISLVCGYMNITAKPERQQMSNHIWSLFSGNIWHFGTTVIQQKSIGIMKSGSLGTIAFNSMLVEAQYQLACIRSGQVPKATACMGDDFVFERPDMPIDQFLAFLNSTGTIVKDHVADGKVHFCSQIMTENDFKAEPEKLEGQWAKLTLVDDDHFDEALCSRQYMYSFQPELLEVVHEALRRRNRDDLVIDPDRLRIIVSKQKSKLSEEVKDQLVDDDLVCSVSLFGFRG
jgi:hypothetical protein